MLEGSTWYQEPRSAECFFKILDQNKSKSNSWSLIAFHVSKIFISKIGWNLRANGSFFFPI